MNNVSGCLVCKGGNADVHPAALQLALSIFYHTFSDMHLFSMCYGAAEDKYGQQTETCPFLQYSLTCNVFQKILDETAPGKAFF